MSPEEKIILMKEIIAFVRAKGIEDALLVASFKEEKDGVSCFDGDTNNLMALLVDLMIKNDNMLVFFSDAVDNAKRIRFESNININ